MSRIREVAPDERQRRGPWKILVQDAPQLSRARRNLATGLADMMTADGTLWVHRGKLAARLALSVRGVDRLLTDLSRHGYLVQTGEQAPNIPARFVGVHPLVRTLPTRDTPRRVLTPAEDPEVSRVLATEVSRVGTPDLHERESLARRARVSTATNLTEKDSIDGRWEAKASGSAGHPPPASVRPHPRVSDQPRLTRVPAVTTEGSGSNSSARDLAKRGRRRGRSHEPGEGQALLPSVLVDGEVPDDAPTVPLAIPHGESRPSDPHALLDALTGVLPQDSPAVRRGLLLLRAVATRTTGRIRTEGDST